MVLTVKVLLGLWIKMSRYEINFKHQNAFPIHSCPDNGDQVHGKPSHYNRDDKLRTIEG